MKTLPILSLIAAATLSACGGGSTPSPSAQTATLTGKVIDGYVQGAKVCLDLNKNDVCDTGEPSATTGPGGSYSLTYPASSVLAETPVLVSIGVGSVDSTNGTVTQPYAMRSMGDSAGVISPFTTLTYYEMKFNLKFNPGKTFNEWSKVISQRLLGSSSAVDVTSDYLASNRPDLLNAARALASSMQITWSEAAPTIEQYQTFNTSAPTLAAWAFANPQATFDQVRSKAIQFTTRDYNVSTSNSQLGNTTPSSMAVDGAGNIFYASDKDVLKLTGGSGVPTSIYTHPTTKVSAVATDASGNVIVLVNDQVLTLKDGKISSVFGTAFTDEMGNKTGLNSAQAMTVANNGKIYIADSGNERVIILDPTSGKASIYRFISGLTGITSIAVGDDGTVFTISPSGIQAYTEHGTTTIKGDAAETALPGWSSLVTDGKGQVFVSDVLRSKIWRLYLNPTDHTINFTLAAGTGKTGKTDGLGSSATFSMPYTLAIDKTGSIYINDLANRTIRMMR